MKWVKRLVVLVVLLVILVLVGAFLFLDSIIKRGVEKVGPAITKVDVKLGGAHISPFSGSGELKKFFVGNPEGYKTPSAFEVGSIALSVVPSSVMSEKVVVRSIRVEAPEITFEGALTGENNLGKLLKNVEGTEEKAPATKEEAKGKSKKMQVDDFLISGAKLHVSATIMGGQAYTVTLPEIHFSNLGQGPEGITATELTRKILDAVKVEALKAASGAAANIGKEAIGAVKGMATNTTGTLEKNLKGVGDLFKKKP